MRMFRNPILLTDSYKVSHYRQYEHGTTSVYSFFESRGGVYPEVVFFGLQYILREYLDNPVTKLDIEEADSYFKAHFGRDIFNRAGWEHIVKDHHGRVPLRIKAVPEGTVVPTHNVLMTVENTCPQCFWLTNYVETLLVQTWYPSTVATQSREMKRTILRYLDDTGDLGLIDFKLHDFGFRGSTSVESAAIGGCAHLVNFKGTDTTPGLILARHYYHCEMAGFSIPAAEHSTITSWGREREVDAFRNMLQQYPDGLVAVVSDSFDIFKACSDLWGTVLHDEVLARDGCLVIRPDSGDPPTVVVKVLDILGEKFGATVNAKGFKVLNPKVRIIQGDGIDPEMLKAILAAMAAHQWSADNIAFGSGGGLLQKVNRDTQKFAFKCSSVVVNGKERLVMKDPVTDHGKKSKAGRLALVCDNYDGGLGWATLLAPQKLDKLVTVFEDGMVKQEWTLDEVRERAAISVAEKVGV